MSLLPSRPDAEPADDAGPRVIGLDDEAADEVLAALSSATARSLLAALHDEPAPPSELADRCDTSLQNVQYHLEKLADAGAIEVVETAYSEKGREMDIYAPADQPLVVFAGDESDGSTLRTALKRLLGAIGLLGLASLLIQVTVDRASFGFGSSADGGDGGGQPGVEYQDDEAVDAPTGEAADSGGTVTETAGSDVGDDGGTQTEPETVFETETPAETVAETATDAARTVTDGAGPGAEDAALGLPPGLLFFAGGLFVLTVVAVGWYVTR